MPSVLPQSELRQIEGYDLTWHRWHPEGQTFTSAFFLIHGQGDYGQRYQEVAEIFLSENIAFATCDLPGHGLSSGKRGHIPSWQLIKKITELGLTEAKTLVPERPIGLGGHSMGGLLALFLLGELEQLPDYSWISSPLLNPTSEQPTWKYLLGRPLSYLLPDLSISTGVTNELCRDDSPEKTAPNRELFHSQISLNWGRIISELAETVTTNPQRIPSSLPLLLTQGGSDHVCPLEFCQQFAESLSLPKLQFLLYPEARHEPFADNSRENILRDLKSWLNKQMQTETQTGEA